MNVNLPSPTSLRSDKEQRLRALLDAQLYLPPLADRLSSGLIQIDTATACRWAGWIDSLKKDEAWSIIEPALRSPESWPEVWDRAREAGFSSSTEHHQAIFFTRLFERAMDLSQLGPARRAWSEALLSWAHLAGTTHIEDVILAPISDDLTEEQLHQVISALLDSPLSMLGDEAIQAINIRVWDAPPMRRPLRFVLDALEHIDEIFTPIEDSPLATGVLAALDLIDVRLLRAVTDELERRLDELDRTTATTEKILTHFDGAISRNDHLGYTVALDRFILRRGLAIIWDLREAGRDEEMDIIAPMIERLTPCAERLSELDEEERLGLEGAIADLFVFVGEEALSLDNRQEAFEKAIAILPGHRNASRLLSYLLLERANRELLKTSALPSASTRLAPIRRRVRPLIERAGEAIERAGELYPENELLSQYWGDLTEEIRRFELDKDPDDELVEDDEEQSP